MSRRNLRCPVYTFGVTNLSNPLKFLQFGVIRCIGDSRNKCYCPRWPIGYEKWFRNLLTNTQIFGLLSDGLPRFTGD